MLESREMTPAEKQRLLDFAVERFRTCFKNITFYSEGMVHYSIELLCEDFLDGVPSTVLEKYRGDVRLLTEDDLNNLDPELL